MAEVKGFTSELMFDNFKKPYMVTETRFDDDSVIRKTMTIEDYTELFQMGLVDERADTFWVALFVPSGERQYICGSTKEILRVPFPSLLFLLDVVHGAPTYQVFSLDSDDFNESMTLYCYPYGHVDTRGSVCMGTANPHLNSISEAEEAVDAFFLGTDSGHLYQAGKNATPSVPLRELVGMVIKKGKFPKTWLKPATNKSKTVKELFHHCDKTIL